MIITYLRSSSYTRYDFCQLAYFIEYNLGIRGDGNKKADLGTIAHKVLECLGKCKLGRQQGKKHITDEIAGQLSTQSMNVDDLCYKVYTYYVHVFTIHNWTSDDFFMVKTLVWKVIQWNDGMFNPFKRDIIAVEQKFDFLIDKSWAKYSDPQQGTLGLKGTIDHISRVDDHTLELIDWKTGRRLNWNTGEEKTFGKLIDDPQLKLYHYAAAKLFPDIENFILTIFYIKDGGPFSIPFGKEDLLSTEDMIRTRFMQIKGNINPPQNRTWKCKKLCHYGKECFQSPTVEYRGRQLTKPGEDMVMCSQVHDYLDSCGIDSTIDKFKVKDWEFDNYFDPGAIR